MQPDQKNISCVSRKEYVQNRENPFPKEFRISRMDINPSRENQNQLSPSGISHIRPAKYL
jgi:hypothetical protein